MLTLNLIFFKKLLDEDVHYLCFLGHLKCISQDLLHVVNDVLIFAGPFGLEGACSEIYRSNRR